MPPDADPRLALADVDARPGSKKPDPILVMDNMSRSFGGLLAVSVDHLEIQRGTITALILMNPFLIFAAVDLFITLCLALSVTTVYPIVRFRAAIGMGFMSLYFYSFDQPLLAGLITVSMLSTFINTFTTRAYVFLITGPGAIGGIAGFFFFYYMYLNPAQV